MTQQFQNNAKSTLLNAIADIDTTLSVQTSDLAKFGTLGVSDFILLTLANSDESIVEIVKCTSIAGNVFSVERAYEGTTNYDWSEGSRIFAAVTAATMDLAIAPAGNPVPTVILTSNATFNERSLQVEDLEQHLIIENQTSAANTHPDVHLTDSFDDLAPIGSKITITFSPRSNNPKFLFDIEGTPQYHEIYTDTSVLEYKDYIIGAEVSTRILPTSVFVAPGGTVTLYKKDSRYWLVYGDTINLGGYNSSLTGMSVRNRVFEVANLQQQGVGGYLTADTIVQQYHNATLTVSGISAQTFYIAEPINNPFGWDAGTLLVPIGFTVHLVSPNATAIWLLNAQASVQLVYDDATFLAQTRTKGSVLTLMKMTHPIEDPYTPGKWLLTGDLMPL